MPLIRCRRYLKLRNILNAANSSQAVLNNFDLGIELRRVIQLLKVAAATTAKVRTWWLNPNAGRCDNFLNRREGDIAFKSLNLHAQAIAGRRQSDKDRAAINVRKAQTSRQNAFDGYLKEDL